MSFCFICVPTETVRARSSTHRPSLRSMRSRSHTVTSVTIKIETDALKNIKHRPSPRTLLRPKTKVDKAEHGRVPLGQLGSQAGHLGHVTFSAKAALSPARLERL